MRSIAIIGAGFAGLSCARHLQRQNIQVVLFDKGRGVGGRMATRRVETSLGTAQFDHGAQFLTARDPGFRAALAELGPAIAPWPSTGNLGGDQHWVGVPGMNAVAKAMAEGLDVRVSTQVTALTGQTVNHLANDGAWLVETALQETHGPFDAIVLAVPAEQAIPLLADHNQEFAAQAAAAHTAPCWAGLFAFPDLPDGQPGMRLENHPVLAWIARDTTKPGRTSAFKCVVAHARADWSASNLEHAPEDVLPRLQSAVCDVLSAQAVPFFAQAHRWRYAQVQQKAQTPFAWDPEKRLGVCGDWRIGARVEAAWQSGALLADAIVQQVRAP